MKLKIFGLEMPMKSKVAGMEKSAIRVESALILIEEEIVTVTA